MKRILLSSMGLLIVFLSSCVSGYETTTYVDDEAVIMFLSNHELPYDYQTTIADLDFLDDLFFDDTVYESYYDDGNSLYHPGGYISQDLKDLLNEEEGLLLSEFEYFSTISEEISLLKLQEMNTKQTNAYIPEGALNYYLVPTSPLLYSYYVEEDGLIVAQYDLSVETAIVSGLSVSPNYKVEVFLERLEDQIIRDKGIELFSRDAKVDDENVIDFMYLRYLSMDSDNEDTIREYQFYINTLEYFVEVSLVRDLSLDQVTFDIDFETNDQAYHFSSDDIGVFSWDTTMKETITKGYLDLNDSVEESERAYFQQTIIDLLYIIEESNMI